MTSQGEASHSYRGVASRCIERAYRLRATGLRSILRLSMQLRVLCLPEIFGRLHLRRLGHSICPVVCASSWGA
nr:putative integron gene cassette protein [uncultured bacterium]